MTLHVAAMYFDYEKNSCGFLLGSDRLGRNIPKEIFDAQGERKHTVHIDDVVLAEKSFRSPNTIGFCSGSFRWPKAEYDSLFRSFDDCFEDIGKRRDYSSHPTLQKAYDATLSIVKRREDTLELYGVYKRRVKGKNPISVRRYMLLTHDSFREQRRTAYWTRLNIPKNPERVYAPGRQPIEHMLWMLRLNMGQEHLRRPTEVAPPFDIYAVDFAGIRKVA